MSSGCSTTTTVLSHCSVRLTADAQDVLSIDRYAHPIGGCRMGFSHADSVCDSDQRSWAVRNLFITDGSACPTQGSANPALTIMAMASRLAGRLTGTPR